MLMLMDVWFVNELANIDVRMACVVRPSLALDNFGKSNMHINL